MLDLDAAARAHAAANPPPDWWPVPPPPLRVWQFHPVVGPPSGGRFGEDRRTTVAEMDEEDAKPAAPVVKAEPRPNTARMDDRDILANVHPGDSLGDVARRLGYTQAGLRYLRHRWPELANAIDMKRGAWVTA